MYHYIPRLCYKPLPAAPFISIFAILAPLIEFGVHRKVRKFKKIESSASKHVGPGKDGDHMTL